MENRKLKRCKEKNSNLKWLITCNFQIESHSHMKIRLIGNNDATVKSSLFSWTLVGNHTKCSYKYKPIDNIWSWLYHFLYIPQNYIQGAKRKHKRVNSERKIQFDEAAKVMELKQEEQSRKGQLRTTMKNKSSGPGR